MKSIWLTLALGVTLTGMNNLNARDSKPRHHSTTAPQSTPTIRSCGWKTSTATRAMDWVKAQNASHEEAVHRQSPSSTRPATESSKCSIRTRASPTSTGWATSCTTSGGQGASARRLAPHHAGRIPQGRRRSGKSLLDIDALNKAENKQWVFKGAQCLKPEFERCLISLSPDGGDAVEVREFDHSVQVLRQGRFRPAGGEDPGRLDRREHDLRRHRFRSRLDDRSRAIRASSRNGSAARRCRRAATVYEGKTDDLAISAFHDRTPGFERDFVSRREGFLPRRDFLRKDGKLDAVDMPDDADVDAHREWLLVQTKSPWTVGGKTYPSGALLATQVRRLHGRQARFHRAVPAGRAYLAGVVRVDADIT